MRRKSAMMRRAPTKARVASWGRYFLNFSEARWEREMNRRATRAMRRDRRRTFHEIDSQEEKEAGSWMIG